jgi:branched-chain amino acid transport system permease protein
MEEFLAVVISGIFSGATYALLALAIVIVFRSTDTVNFAIGDMGTISVYVAFTAMSLGLPVVLALVLAVIVSGAFGFVVQRLLIQPLGHGQHVLFVALVITIGLGLLIHAGILLIWGATPFSFPPLVDGTASLFGIALPLNRIVAAGVAVALMLSVAWFFKASPIGISMRAAADDSFAARLIGISPKRVAGTAWFVGCGLSAVAAFFLAADASLSSNLTISSMFRAFAGVFFGGLTSLSGAAIGGFAVGILDNLAGRYVSASYRDTIVFSFIVLVLFLRPAGFLGAGRKERV